MGGLGASDPERAGHRRSGIAVPAARPATQARKLPPASPHWPACAGAISSISVLDALIRRGYERIFEPSADGEDGEYVLERDGQRFLLSSKHGAAYVLGSTAIAEFAKSIRMRNLAGGLLVTPGQFAPEALPLARAQRIELLDGPALWPELRPLLPEEQRDTISAPAQDANASSVARMGWRTGHGRPAVRLMHRQDDAATHPAPVAPFPLRRTQHAATAPLPPPPACASHRPCPARRPTTPSCSAAARQAAESISQPADGRPRHLGNPVDAARPSARRRQRSPARDLPAARTLRRTAPPTRLQLQPPPAAPSRCDSCSAARFSAAIDCTRVPKRCRRRKIAGSLNRCRTPCSRTRRSSSPAIAGWSAAPSCAGCRRAAAPILRRPRPARPARPATPSRRSSPRTGPTVVVLAAAKVGGILANTTYPARLPLRQPAHPGQRARRRARGTARSGCCSSARRCIYPKLAPQPIREDCAADRAAGADQRRLRDRQDRRHPAGAGAPPPVRRPLRSPRCRPTCTGPATTST